MLLASKSLLHVDINHRSLYSIYILEHNTKQCERCAGNDPEPLGLVFLQGHPFTLMISLT